MKYTKIKILLIALLFTTIYYSPSNLLANQVSPVLGVSNTDEFKFKIPLLNLTVTDESGTTVPWPGLPIGDNYAFGLPGDDIILKIIDTNFTFGLDNYIDVDWVINGISTPSQHEIVQSPQIDIFIDRVILPTDWDFWRNNYTVFFDEVETEIYDGTMLNYYYSLLENSTEFGFYLELEAVQYNNYFKYTMIEIYEKSTGVLLVKDFDITIEDQLTTYSSYLRFIFQRAGYVYTTPTGESTVTTSGTTTSPTASDTTSQTSKATSTYSTTDTTYTSIYTATTTTTLFTNSYETSNSYTTTTPTTTTDEITSRETTSTTAETTAVTLSDTQSTDHTSTTTIASSTGQNDPTSSQDENKITSEQGNQTDSTSLAPPTLPVPGFTSVLTFLFLGIVVIRRRISSRG